MIVMKAGAFVRCGDRYVLMFGPHPCGSYLGVVRLGGHREGDETPWACAAREVLEEASMHIRPVLVPVTYWGANGVLTEISWAPGEVRPLLVTQYGEGDGAQVTVLYLAESDDTPVPDAETKGLLLPTLPELERLASSVVTLDEYLAAGGQALIRTPIDPRMRLECSHQVWLAAKLLTSR